MRAYHNKTFRLQLNVLIMPVAEKLNTHSSCQNPPEYEAKPAREYNGIFQKKALDCDRDCRCDLCH